MAGIADFNEVPAADHMLRGLLCQLQIALAWVGWQAGFTPLCVEPS